MKNNLIAYAIDFISFLMQKISEKNKIRKIILFGSVAREEASKESDIDIFIDIKKDDKKLEEEINLILNDYKNSVKYKKYWYLIGIKNEIKITIGNIKKWDELKPSLISNGIVLYGKFEPEIKEGRHKSFFIWENIKPNSKRVLFNKYLFGYNQNKKRYLGLLDKNNGERMGKGCIIVPADSANIFLSLFRKFKITVKIKKVLEYF